MAAIPVGDEIKIRVCFRMGDGQQRGAPRIADRLWWQPVADIGVNGRGIRQILMRQGTIQLAPPFAEDVNDGRVGLQTHRRMQAVIENAGDARALFRFAGFLFHDGGENDGVMRRGQRQAGIAVFPDLIQFFLHRFLHARYQSGAAVAEIKAIGFRQQGTFRRWGYDSAGQLRRVVQHFDDFGGGQPFGDGEQAHHRTPVAHHHRDIRHADTGRQFIFPGF